MYKICSKCKNHKLFEDFSKNATRKDGYANQCKSCTNEYTLINKEKRSELKRIYYENNKHVIAEYNRINRERIAVVKSNYQKMNKDKVNCTAAKRRAVKLHATPSWLTKEDIQEIEQFYIKAQQMNNHTGEKHHVDHIVPLQGENVCGLHVPWNLQVIPAKENISKSNKLIE
jgi:hypothetical protein